MGGITQALAATARARGVCLKTGVLVERITVEASRATGVVLEDGTTVRLKDAQGCFAAVCEGTTRPIVLFLNKRDLFEHRYIQSSFPRFFKRYHPKSKGASTPHPELSPGSQATQSLARH